MPNQKVRMVIPKENEIINIEGQFSVASYIGKLLTTTYVNKRVYVFCKDAV